MKYLGGDASKCIGEHTVSLTEAFDLLKKTFGNPMIIWNQKKEDIADALGNYGIWGKANSLERRNAIIQMIDFINEATTLATEHSKLRNEINSESTYRDIFVLLPNNIRQDVLEKIDPEKPLSEKFTLMKDLLISHRNMTVHCLELCQTVKKKEDSKSFQKKANVSSLKPLYDDHDCQSSFQCRTDDWDYLGCIELYKIEEIDDRITLMIRKRICYKCGSNYVNARFNPHVCVWNDAKEDARCTGLHCDRAAATCRRHSDTDNASEELKDWLARNETQFVSNVVTVNSPQANIYAHPSVINEFKAFLESCNIKLKNLSSEDLKFKFTEFMEMRNSEQSARVLSVVKNSNRNSTQFPDSDVAQVLDEVKTSSFRYRCHTVNVAKDSQMRGNSSPSMKPLIPKIDQSDADEFFDAHENLVSMEAREKCYSSLDTIAVHDAAVKPYDHYPAPVNPVKSPRKEVEMDGKTYCINSVSRSSLMLTMVLLNLLLTLWFGCMLMSFKM